MLAPFLGPSYSSPLPTDSLKSQLLNDLGPISPRWHGCCFIPTLTPNGESTPQGEPDTDTGQTIFRKDVRDALVREALKDEAFREVLLANPKFAVERALGTPCQDRLEVVLLRETEDLMYIVLPKEFPADAANLSDSELEAVAGGLLDTNVQTQSNTCLSQLSSVVQL